MGGRSVLSDRDFRVVNAVSISAIFVIILLVERSITLPFIKPTIIMTLLLRTIWVFNNADMIYVITQGGPGNSTHTLSSYLYAKSLSSLDFGYTAALGLIFMIGLAIYASIVIRVTNYEEAGDF